VRSGSNSVTIGAGSCPCSTDGRIAEAEASLRRLLGRDRLDGLSFVDVGSGSGLFSLAARRLGARVHSLDYDPRSVACTAELRQRYHHGDPLWTVERGSALDAEYLQRLGRFDIVYSWGVLHHTGAMWQAIELVAALVSPGGTYCLALYNDQGGLSRFWWVDQISLQSHAEAVRLFMGGCYFVLLYGAISARDILRGRPGHTWREYWRRPWHEPLA
jgi:2-polyprenyl-3-methyl-5-hydroxy-6-metoxy-1,4-benzoquinol methylase